MFRGRHSAPARRDGNLALGLLPARAKRRSSSRLARPIRALRARARSTITPPDRSPIVNAPRASTHRARRAHPSTPSSNPHALARRSNRSPRLARPRAPTPRRPSRVRSIFFPYLRHDVPVAHRDHGHRHAQPVVGEHLRHPSLAPERPHARVQARARRARPPASTRGRFRVLHRAHRRGERRSRRRHGAHRGVEWRAVAAAPRRRGARRSVYVRRVLPPRARALMAPNAA